MSKPTTNPEDKISKVSSARKLLIVALIAGGVIAIIYFFFLGKEEGVGMASEQSSQSNTVEEPPFLEEGTLWFLSDNQQDTLQQITIEVADDQEQRAQGMMHRSAMDELQGMLFIHDRPEVQAYWMKNTKLPLDIIYVGENKEIVTIYQGVMPYSEKSIPSSSEALYVVEVNAGFTGRHKVEEGDFIAFELLN
ncbi:DUF192 domain-containing protein [Tunicatimonas pelagia]|uniref:DUF192 domain-containing protein n=1 Tax=Tunicatimonas pelagia TaxID=931531 RepID=UPI0026657D96|nr:DUF192 domain-containing protein [Tunicatimonas pelagia]WKN43747.1 DUF192 domain-containing protein [Tunicatimonas pelagia]